MAIFIVREGCGVCQLAAAKVADELLKGLKLERCGYGFGRFDLLNAGATQTVERNFGVQLLGRVRYETAVYILLVWSGIVQEWFCGAQEPDRSISGCSSVGRRRAACRCYTIITLSQH